MAARRMYSIEITESDIFLELSLSAQALYFHLAQNCDDEGFCNAARKIIRYVGASNEDLAELENSGFIIGFPSGVIAIRHWNVHNTIQNDRKKPTSRPEINELVLVDKVYEFRNGYNMDTEWIQNGYNTDTQISIDKNSIIEKISCAPKSHETHSEEEEKEEQLKKDFEIIYDLYPKKRGRTAAYGFYKQWVSDRGRKVNDQIYHLTNRQIWLAVKKYVDQQDKNGIIDHKFWKNFDKLMGNDLLDYVDFGEDDHAVQSQENESVYTNGFWNGDWQ